MISPNNRTIGNVLAVLGLLFLSVACGSGSKVAGPSTQPIKVPSIPGTTSNAASSTGAAGGAAQAVTSSDAARSSATTTNWDRKIIRNADLALKVTNVESMLATVRSITDSAGGVVFASSTSFNGDDQIATMTLDIPSGEFDRVVNALRAAPGVKKVEREAITSQDVTGDYVDLQSQLRNLVATQTRLAALMDKATQLQDVLTLEQELSKVEGQIEQTTGRINYLDKRSSFSRVTLTLSPFVFAAHPSAQPGFDLANAVHDAWAASLRFTGGILTGLVKAGVFLWWFWPLVVIAARVWHSRRQRRTGAHENSKVAA